MTMVTFVVVIVILAIVMPLFSNLAVIMTMMIFVVVIVILSVVLSECH